MIKGLLTTCLPNPDEDSSDSEDLEDVLSDEDGDDLEDELDIDEF